MKHYHSLSFLRNIFLNQHLASILVDAKIKAAKSSNEGACPYTPIPSLFLFVVAGTTAFGQTEAFLDNYNRAALTTGAPTTYSLTVTAGDGGASLITNSFLELSNDVSATANADGIVYISGLTQDYLSAYNQTLHSNSSNVEWAFNFRYARSTNPSGLAASNYGTAIILASSNNIFTGTGAGNGYAVVYGSSGAPDPIRMVKFAGGLTGTVTTIISSGNSDISVVNNYVSVRVKYEPNGDSWSLYVRDDGASNWSDPSTNVTIQKGVTMSDNTYTSLPLPQFGFYWAYASATGQTSQFDNFGVYLTNANNPTITVNTSSLPTFGTILVGSSSSTQNFAINGTNLTDHISITSPMGFEMRTGTNPFSTNPITLIQSNGTIENSIIDVRFTPVTASSYSGTIECTSPGADARNIVVSGIGASTGVELFLTSDPTQADSAHAVLFPHAGIGNGTVYAEDDWTYDSPKLTLYVVPIGLQSIGASEFEINWDTTKETLTVSNGNMFDFFASQNIAPGKIRINNGASSNLNVLPGSGKYIAKLEFTVLQPGFNDITITGADFRFFEGEIQQNLQVATHSGKIKFYLGDVASQNTVTESGDGKINFNDLVQLALSYFSESDGNPAGYKTKFDIGPTNSNGSCFAMPNPDGQIQFEDLAIFSIGYGKTAALQLPKKNAMPVVFSVQALSETSDEIVTVPLAISGSSIDVRAFSISLAYPSNSLEYLGCEKRGEMFCEYCFMAAKASENTVTLDAAIIGIEHDGLSKEGVFANVIFRQRNKSKSYRIDILSAIARDHENHDIKIFKSSEVVRSSVVPAGFSLTQNYPNPFNPKTVIRYELPVASQASLKVFDMLGKEIAVLVDKQQNAGSYRVVWNGKDAEQHPVSSGIYFYQIRVIDPASNASEGYVSVKKMILLK